MSYYKQSIPTEEFEKAKSELLPIITKMIPQDITSFFGITPDDIVASTIVWNYEFTPDSPLADYLNQEITYWNMYGMGSCDAGLSGHSRIGRNLQIMIQNFRSIIHVDDEVLLANEEPLQIAKFDDNKL